MKPFRFSLQSLGPLREQKENTALEIYAAKLSERHTAQASAARAQDAFEAARQEWSAASTKGQTAAELRLLAQNCQLLIRRREDQMQKLAQAHAQSESARREMLQARQQREILDHLRGQQKHAYDLECARQEQKVADEQASQIRFRGAGCVHQPK